MRRAAFKTRQAPVKAVLLDQSVVAGYGNLCVDEVLFHAGVAPAASARMLTPERIEAIIDATLEHLIDIEPG